MTTTPAAIRDSIAARIVALTPTAHVAQTFREHREQEPLRLWAEANPTGCLRRYSVRWGDSETPADVMGAHVEQVERELEIVVAYPTDWRHGNKQLVDLDTVVGDDRGQIDNSVGTNGYADLGAATSYSATIITVGKHIERGPVVTFGALTLRVRYTRSN